MKHIISATATTDGQQLSMCGAPLGSYQEAVDAGHPVGNYLPPTLEAARARGVSCPSCLEPLPSDDIKWTSINDIIPPVVIRASNGNLHTITHIDRSGFGLPIVVMDGQTSTWTRETRFEVVEGPPAAETTNIPFTRLTVRADHIKRGDRLVFAHSIPCENSLVDTGAELAGPPVTAVEPTAAGTYAIDTINGGRRLHNAWDTVTVLRPDPSCLHESRVWSFESIDLP